MNTSTATLWMTFFCAFLIGANKSGLKGVSAITLPLLAHAYGGMTSVAVLLPFLIVGDVMALLFYKKSIHFKYVAKLLPFALMGIAIATFTGKYIDDTQFTRTIGYAILFCSLILLYSEFFKNGADLSKYPWLTRILGVSGGFATMIGNAAGAIFNMYILGMHLPKTVYIATGASFYIIMNVIKLPIQTFYWHSVTADTLHLNLICLPALVVGAFVGRKIASYIPEKPYRYFIIIVTIGSAMFMIF